MTAGTCEPKQIFLEKTGGFLTASLGPLSWDHVTASGFFYWIVEQSDETVIFFIVIRLLSELSFSQRLTSCSLDLPAYTFTADIIRKKKVRPVQMDLRRKKTKNVPLFFIKVISVLFIAAALKSRGVYPVGNLEGAGFEAECEKWDGAIPGS